MKKKFNILSEMAKIQEAAPAGSFEDLRDKVSEALKDANLFPGRENDFDPYIRYLFFEKIIVSHESIMYEVPYSILEGAVTFGNPVKVTEVYVPVIEARGDGQGAGGQRQGDGGADTCKCPKCGHTQKHAKGIPCNKSKCAKCDTLMVGINSAIAKESAFESMDLREGIVRGSNPHDEDIKLGEFISLKEAVFNEETGEFENVVLIESGTNKSIPAKHYPMSTLKEAAPIFAGMKMYLNHPTRTEERELPERDITKWASTIVESKYREMGGLGQVTGNIAVHDAWLKERLADPIARSHLGLSILTGGKISYGSVSGKNMEIVEKIVRRRQGGPASVDWVTEPGAGGHVPLKESKKEGNEMELASLTMKELREGRPDLANAIIKESKDAETNGTKDTQLKEALSENKKLKEAESKRGQLSKVDELLKESKLPDVGKSRVKDTVMAKIYDSETDLKEAVTAAIKTESEYINQFSVKGKIKTGNGGNEVSLKESLGSELDARAGVSEQKKKED